MRAIPAGANTDLVGAYVAEKTGCEFQPGMFQAMAVLDDSGNFCAGVVISEYRGYDCQISCATEAKVTWRPHVIKAVFEYIFVQLDCTRCTSLTKKTNKRTRSFLEGLGFQLEGRVRKGYDGVKDALIYGLLREECVYIQEFVDGNLEAAEDAEGADSGGFEGSLGQSVLQAAKATDRPPEALNGTVPDFWTF